MRLAIRLYLRLNPSGGLDSDSIRSTLKAAPSITTKAVKYIHINNPIAAANPP